MIKRARALLAAAEPAASSCCAPHSPGAARARGAFTDVLDALTVLLHERARDAATAR